MSGGPPPTPLEASRLIYGIGAIIHLTRTVQIASMPFSDPSADELGQSLLADVFALTGGQAFEQRAEFFSVDNIDVIAELFASQFNSWKDWIPVSQQLVTLGVLTQNTADIPLCNACVITYDGIQSVVVNWVLSSNQVSLNALKAVVDPRNWHDDDPSFFCAMQYEGLRTDGWRRVLETVGFCSYPTAISPRLVTMLKFFKTTVNPNGPGKYEARLDYELNDPFPTPPATARSPLTTASSTCGPGTTETQTSHRSTCGPKGYHIDGLRPYTMKRFVCLSGYAFIVANMLFGSASNPDPNAVAWADSPNEQPSDLDEQPPGGSGAQAPPSDNSVASTAISMVTKSVEELTVKQFDLADKWMSGQLTVAELAQHSAEVGARIASEPWKLIQAITQPKGGGK